MEVSDTLIMTHCYLNISFHFLLKKEGRKTPSRLFDILKRKNIIHHHRRMKKWRPFATMPEQYIGLKEMINKQAEVAQPVLIEEQMEQINFTLIEALHTNKQVYLTYYKQGECITETGFIQFVDSLENLFIFIDDVFELKNKMRLSELIDVRLA